MGRAKSNMELIKKVKIRNATFQKRKGCLLKKAQELAILCGIKAVVIIYGPKQAPTETEPVEPETWPKNREEAVELINKYKSQSPEDRKKRTSLLSDFFMERNKKAQQALTKLRGANIQSKYPTWDPKFDMMQEDDLRRIAGDLAMNIENAKAKLQQMKYNNSHDIYRACYMQQQQQAAESLSMKKRNMEFEVVNQANKRFIAMNPHQTIPGPMPIPRPMTIPNQMHMPVDQQQRFSYTDHYSNQKTVNFGGNYVGGIPNVFYNAAPPSYNDLMMAGTMNNLSYVNNFAGAPLMHSYGDAMQQLMACNSLDYHRPMSGSAHNQISAMSSHQDGDYDQCYDQSYLY